MLPPSILAHGLNALFMVSAFVIGIANYKKVVALDTYRLLIVVLLFSVAVGVHGISHALLEKHYNFRPWVWRWN